MKIGCCMDSAHYDLVAVSGYHSITFPGVELAFASDDEFAKIAAKVAAGPLAIHSVNSFCPGTLRLTGADLDLAALEAYAHKLFPRAAKLGAEYIGIGSPASRSTRPGESWEAALDDLKRSLEMLCRIGGEYGLTILLESVCSLECNVVTYASEAADMVRRMALPNLGLVYDIYHTYMMHESPNEILQMGDLIKVVHIARNMDNQRGYLREEDIHKYYPYLQMLGRVGYEGECSVEAFVGELSEELCQSKTILDRVLSVQDT